MPNRISYLLLMTTLRQALSLFLAGLLLCAQSFAQSPTISQMPSPGAQPDLKRARKAAEQGGKPESTCRLGDALDAYEDTPRQAPQDTTIVSRYAPRPM